MQTQITQFLEYVAASKATSSVNTTAAYRNDLNQLQTYLNQKVESWSEVTSTQLEDFIGILIHERNYASSTVARKVASIKSFFQYLTSAMFISSDPSKTLNSPKVKKSKPRLIDADEIIELLAAPMQHDPPALRDKAILEILYSTGMRVTELVNLNVDDIDFIENTITCRIETKAARILPVEEDVQEYLGLYINEERQSSLERRAEKEHAAAKIETEEAQSAEEPHTLVVEPVVEPALFLNHRGKRLTRQGLWLIIKRYVAQVGIEGTVTPHTLRHSFAAHLIDDGADLSEVQKRLGHASVSTTQIYRKLKKEAEGGVPDGQPTDDNHIPTNNDEDAQDEDTIEYTWTGKSEEDDG
ncbi:MAG: tyrosine-type recombinase/integrase [Chloroflexota bacterium]